MLAEVAYSVIQALPEEEKARLYVMLEKERKPVEPKPKKDKIWTVQECVPVLLKHLTDRKNRQFANGHLNVVK